MGRGKPFPRSRPQGRKSHSPPGLDSWPAGGPKAATTKSSPSRPNCTCDPGEEALNRIVMLAAEGRLRRTTRERPRARTEAGPSASHRARSYATVGGERALTSPARSRRRTVRESKPGGRQQVWTIQFRRETLEICKWRATAL